MKKLLSIFLLVLFAAQGCSLVSTSEQAMSENVKSSFVDALDCGDADIENSAYCAVTHIGDFDLVLPDDVQTYLGFSMALVDGDDVESSIVATSHVAALHLGPETARLTALVATTEEDEIELGQISADIETLLSGVEHSFDISEGLASYLDGERDFTGYTILESTVTSATYDSPLPYTIHYTGNAYVVIEDAIGGVYVSVFPDTPVS